MQDSVSGAGSNAYQNPVTTIAALGGSGLAAFLALRNIPGFPDFMTNNPKVGAALVVLVATASAAGVSFTGKSLTDLYNIAVTNPQTILASVTVLAGGGGAVYKRQAIFDYFKKAGASKELAASVAEAGKGKPDAPVVDANFDKKPEGQ
jgi:hypothetical protein